MRLDVVCRSELWHGILQRRTFDDFGLQRSPSRTKRCRTGRGHQIEVCVGGTSGAIGGCCMSKGGIAGGAETVGLMYLSTAI